MSCTADAAWRPLLQGTKSRTGDQPRAFIQALAELAAGTLVRVLKERTPPLDGLCLYYPGRRHAPAGLRALIQVIREHAEARRA